MTEQPVRLKYVDAVIDRHFGDQFETFEWVSPLGEKMTLRRRIPPKKQEKQDELGTTA